jgi:hypothetical protein
VSKNIKTEIYTTLKFFVLYGCETWPFTLREELGLRVFMNRVLRKILGPKRNEVRGEWRRLYMRAIPKSTSDWLVKKI